MVYGHQVLGTAPSLMLGLRRKACRAIAGKGFGRCMTTALALLMGDEDPGLSLPQQLVSEWLQFWRRHPEHHARVKRAWATIYGELSGRPPERRWAKVKGAVSAIICTLLTAGWGAPTATEWTSDTDEIWRMSEGPSEVDDAELLEEVAASIKRTWWRQAAQHDAGKGLEDGPDLHQARRHLARLEREGDHSAWALQLQVMAGASWTRVRQHERRLADSEDCPRWGSTPRIARPPVC